MKLYISVTLAITLFICGTSCQQNNNGNQPIKKEIGKQNDLDSLNAKNALNELAQRIIASPIYLQYDSLLTELNFEKRIAYDEYLITRKQNNNAEIITLINNNGIALAKKREALLKLGFKLSYQYERVSVAMVLTKTRLINAFPELLTMNPTEQEHVLQLATQKKSRAVQSPI